MSLLDDVSIVVTPNGYKAGELYAVIPSDGAADMDVTRATAATRVDENGLVNYAEILGSEEIDCGDFECASPLTDWSFIGTTEISGGTANFPDITNSFLIQNFVVDLTIKTYKLSYEVVTTNGGNFRLAGGNSAFGLLTLDSATVGVKTKYITSNGTKQNLQFNNNTFIGSISNVSVKEVTRDNVPRIDYTGGGCPHILAEPMRTNLITYSEEISQYSDTNTTVIPDDTTSPDGTVNASKVTKDGANANDRVYINNFVILNATDYSLSVFIKNDDIVNGGVSTISARISGGTLFRQGYEWNGSTLSITSSQASGTRTNVLLEDYGNGWWKVGFSFTSDGTSADIEFDLDRINGTDTTAIFLWGTQLEVGSYATSYIPNFGTALGVTRNQDIFTRDGIGSLINSTEGVLFVEMAALSDDSTDRVMSLSDGTNNHRILLAYTSTTNQIQAFHNDNVSPVNLVFTVSDVTDFHKVAFKYKVNDFALWVDGVEVATNNTKGVNMANTLNELKFENASGTNVFYGKVKQLQVFKTALTDPELATLTT